MSDSETPQLTQKSIDNVRALIAQKNSEYTFMSNGTNIRKITTDYDHYPYTRWFRGVYYYPDPIVAEREAGFRPIENVCYGNVQPYTPEPESRACFEAPCNTIFPVYCPKDRPNTAIMNKNCIIEYR